MNEFYVNWGGDRIKLTWMPTTEIFNAQLITSAHAVCFYEDDVLLVDIKSRGFDLPGVLLYTCWDVDVSGFVGFVCRECVWQYVECFFNPFVI